MIFVRREVTFKGGGAPLPCETPPVILVMLADPKLAMSFVIPTPEDSFILSPLGLTCNMAKREDKLN